MSQSLTFDQAEINLQQSDSRNCHYHQVTLAIFPGDCQMEVFVCGTMTKYVIICPNRAVLIVLI